jgi:high-affinity Fe2+/Pb2+ permease
VTHDQVTSRRADRLAIYLIGTGIVLGVVAVVLFMLGFSMLIEETANAPDYLPTSDFISDTTRALIISAGLVGAVAGVVFLWGLVRLVQKSM